MKDSQNQITTKATAKPVLEVPLCLVLVVPFVIQIVLAVGITAYMSFLDSKESVEDLATQLMSEVEGRIDEHLENYLTAPPSDSIN